MLIMIKKHKNNSIIYLISKYIIIDMGRTAINVTGTMVAATLTAKKEYELDLEVYYKDKSNQEVVEEI